MDLQMGFVVWPATTNFNPLLMGNVPGEESVRSSISGRDPQNGGVLLVVSQ